ncbi:MAG: tryptophan synthase subunit alpha [Agathobacter sp.]|nr:tryptophan synthase subunit alpha [Agathobacter sp.]
MSKISEAFSNKKAFIGFLTAGDPSLEKTEEFIVEMEKAGAALIEIGIPFSDPIAEGPVIQEANVRALSAPGGCTTDMVFDMVERVSKKVSVPLVFLTYLNPVFSYGYDRFCKRCKEAGVSGIIIPDMPFEERGELIPFAEKHDVELISLIAPTSEERIQMIAKEAKGYIYVVSSMGVTGIRSEITTDIGEIIANIRKATDTPVAIGFGINTPEQAASYSQMADGVIVGSAIVKIIQEHGVHAGKYVYDYVRSMVDGM